MFCRTTKTYDSTHNGRFCQILPSNLSLLLIVNFLSSEILKLQQFWNYYFAWWCQISIKLQLLMNIFCVKKPFSRVAKIAQKYTLEIPTKCQNCLTSKLKKLTTRSQNKLDCIGQNPPLWASHEIFSFRFCKICFRGKARWVKSWISFWNDATNKRLCLYQTAVPACNFFTRLMSLNNFRMRPRSEEVPWFFFHLT